MTRSTVVHTTSLMMLIMLFACLRMTTVRGAFLPSPTAFCTITKCTNKVNKATLQASTTVTKTIKQRQQHPMLAGSVVRSSSSVSSLFATTKTTSDDEKTTRPRRRVKKKRIIKKKKKKIPMTLLSGFLGSGKTTTLKHLLENTEGTKIGVVVNDVAEVNVDAKLVSQTNANGIMELQNGCACCSLADEMVTTLDTLITSKSGDLDAIVIELSGVADPVAIQSNWNMAKLSKHPATTKTDIANVVTLIDACTFGTDWLTEDNAGDRPYWTEGAEDCSRNRQVTELLAEQVEAADVILINKVDLAEPTEVLTASKVARGLNKDAKLAEVEHGKISPSMVLGSLLDAETTTKTQEKKKEEKTSSHEHHEHASHSHDHDHDCADPDCTDSSHSHDHQHDTEADACTDPDCTDTTHSHSHSHDASSTSTDNLGITNFVYKRDRPFDGARLMALLNQWPVPQKDTLNLQDMQVHATEEVEIWGQKQKVSSPFVGVLRSKGFCWTAPQQWFGGKQISDAWRHDTVLYWSHAGRHFSITTSGKWWGTITPEEMKQFVTNEKEYARISKEDFVTEEWSDRRQELVFIGTGISETDISAALDECLVTDEEMEDYRDNLQKFQETTTDTAGGFLDNAWEGYEQ